LSRKLRPPYFSKKAFGMAFQAAVEEFFPNSLPIQLKRSALTVTAKFGKLRPPCSFLEKELLF